MAEESESLTTAQVIEHLDYVQDIVMDEINARSKFLNEDHWQMIANALDRLRELDAANGKLGQRATKAEHNCESARALAEQSLKRWVALEAEHAQLKARLLEQNEFEIEKVELKIKKRVLDQIMKNEREHSERLRAQNAELKADRDARSTCYLCRVLIEPVGTPESRVPRCTQCPEPESVPDQESER